MVNDWPVVLQLALGLIDVDLADDRAQLLQAHAVGSQRRRVGHDAHGGLLSAADADQPHARQLRNLLREGRVGQILDLGQRHAVRGHGQRENRRVGGIDLAVNRRRGQIVGQISLRRIDRGLHFLLGHVNVLFQIELQGDDRSAEGAARGHLAQAGQLAELPLQRSGNRRGRNVGAGARDRTSPPGWSDNPPAAKPRSGNCR